MCLHGTGKPAASTMEMHDANTGGGDILGSTSFQKGAEAHILLDLLWVQPTVIRIGFLCEMED